MRDGDRASGPIRAAQASLICDGRSLPVSEVGVQREIVGDMPHSITGGGGFAAGELSATISGADQSVVAKAPNPLTHPNALLEGRQIKAYLGDVGGPLHQWADMRVETVGGSATSTSLSLSARDDLRRLSSDWWYQPLLATMPPLEAGGDYRQIGLLNTAVTHLMLRHLGRTCTPQASAVGADAIVDAPMMGSLLTKAGLVRRAEWGGTRAPTSWGVAMGNFLVTWDFPGDIVEKSCGLVVSTASQPTGGSATVEFSTVQGVAWKLHVARTYVVVKDRFDNELTSRLSHTGEGRVGVECRWSGDSAAFVVRSSQTSQTATGTGTLTTATVARLCRAFTDGPGLLGSVTVVRNPAHTKPLMEHKPNAVMHMHINDTHPLRAMPTQQGTDPATLLQEQSAADCAAMWVDGEGVWHIAGREWLRNRAPVRTLTAHGDLHEWGWSRSADTTPSAVIVKSRIPAVSLSQHPTILLWQGQGGTLDAGDTLEEWIESGGDTDWVEPDLTPISAHSPANAEAVNRGRGTVAGAHWTDPANGDSLGPAWSDGGSTLEQVGPGTLRYSVTWQGNPPRSGANVQLAIDPNAPGIASRWRGQSTLILRGSAKTEWRDSTTDPAPVTGARTTAPTLTHDTGWWVQESTARARLRDWLAERAAEMHVRPQSIRIAPDFRLELGDVVRVEDDVTGVTTVGVVTEIGASVTGSKGEMTIVVRPTQAQSAAPTVGEVDLYHHNRTVAQVDTHYSGRTVEQVDDGPTPAT